MEKFDASRALLDIGAVFLRPDEPFIWASGIKAPIYCDNRLILSAPEMRSHVEQALADSIAAGQVHPGESFTACVQDGQVVLRSENDAAGQRAEATV